MLVVLVVSPGIVDGVAALERQLSYFRGRVEFRRLLSRQIFLEHLKIFTGKWQPVMIVADQRRRLQAVDQAISPVQMPVSVRLVPPAVKPDARDFTITREQLAKLIVLKFEITVPVAMIRPPGGLARAPARKIIGVMPVQLRMVEK